MKKKAQDFKLNELKSNEMSDGDGSITYYIYISDLSKYYMRLNSEKEMLPINPFGFMSKLKNYFLSIDMDLKDIIRIRVNKIRTQKFRNPGMAKKNFITNIRRLSSKLLKKISPKQLTEWF